MPVLLDQSSIKLFHRELEWSSHLCSDNLEIQESEVHPVLALLPQWTKFRIFSANTCYETLVTKLFVSESGIPKKHQPVAWSFQIFGNFSVFFCEMSILGIIETGVYDKEF